MIKRNEGSTVQRSRLHTRMIAVLVGLLPLLLLGWLLQGSSGLAAQRPVQPNAPAPDLEAVGHLQPADAR